MKNLFIIIFLTLFIASCTSSMPSPSATPIPSFTLSPLPTLTATPPPTESPTPTQTQTPIPVKDLDPIYTENIDQEYMGVQITTSLITDESLSRSNPQITKISINPNYRNYKGEKSEIAIADFMARTVFEVWWKNGEIEHKGLPTEDDFKAFMEMWSLAQKENNFASWEKVQFSIFANDLNTSGYNQEKVTILPMYTGNQPPNDVLQIREINIAFVRGPRMENIILYSNTGEYYGDGIGVNIDKNKLFVYVALGFGYNNPANNVFKVVGDMTDIPRFLINNKGGSLDRGSAVDRSDRFGKLLATNRSSSAIKVYPPQK